MTEQTALNGKYRAYPEYKDSGVEWLGEVPEHWELTRVKYVAEITPKKPSVRREQSCSFIPMEKLKTDVIELSETRKINDVYDGYTYFANGDILMAKVTPCFENKNIAIAEGLVNQIGFGSSEIYPIRVNERTSNRFLFYRLQEDGFMELAIGAMTGAGGLRRVPSETLANYCCAVPAFEEQQKIADFLDHETAKIDTLIDKQQQLIQLLKEKRQAVISHAVTRGLNPNAPMRDSGVEWLGEVPEHWVVRRLKHTSKLQSGIPKGKDLTGKLSISVPMLRVANVQDGFLDLEDMHVIEIEPDQLHRFSLQIGDVLMNEGGDNDKLGRGAVWQCEVDPCVHQNHVFAIRPYSIEPEWLDLITRSSYAKFHFYRVAKQSTNLASISSTNIKETPLTIPPEAERKVILKYVQVKLKCFEKIEEQCIAQIKLMQERRTALISAAVTGKIDVRHFTLKDGSPV